MEKYGVNECREVSPKTQKEKEKLASEKIRCPQCGRVCEISGLSVVRCPEHGTEPFER